MSATTAPPKTLSPVDFFDVNSLLSDEERQVRASVARWVDDRFLPIIADAFDEHRRGKASETVPAWVEEILSSQL